MKIWVKSLLWSPRVSEYPESAEQKMMSLFGEAMINSLIFKCPLSLNPYFTFILPVFLLPALIVKRDVSLQHRLKVVLMNTIDYP